jgi:hypothetical protein
MEQEYGKFDLQKQEAFNKIIDAYTRAREEYLIISDKYRNSNITEKDIKNL